MTKENLLQHLQECCDRMFGCSLEMATEKQVYRAVCVAVRELLEDERRAFVEQIRAQENKQVYYMSMEFLVGTSLRNNLFNMGLLEPAGEILNELGFSLERLCALEPDAGLGNGGLGRLASCYMDAATGLGYPVTGFSIRYEFGIFRQKIVDGWQMEFPDNWLEMGDVWLHPRKDDAVEVRFGGQVHEWMDGGKFKTAQTGYQSVIAVPHDLYISGYNSTAVNKLTLWSASMPQSFDMNAFSRGDYVRALEQNTMAEALERWPVDLFREQLPRIYAICQEINRRLMEKLQRVYPNDPGKWNYMAVIANDEVRMANLCLTCCHKINGVSQLHTDILEKTIFRDYYNLDHSRFLNITNGIAYRRWLCQSNPALSGYLQTLIGDGFLKDANALEALEQYRGDLDVLENLRAIKRKNKVRLAAYIAEHNGVNVDPDSIFDVQVKRLHEYKRQLLNVLYILTLYNEIKDHPEKPVFPQTFIFAAKASAGYYLAKQIISLIVAVSNLVNSDPQVQGKLKVVFIEDYKVSLAEIIIPAADLSEQISVAGKEASGTSNRKLMINGAVTLGTLDGANVEIRDRVGDDNMFLFGMTADEVQALWQRGYDPHQFLTPELDRVLQMLTSGALGQRFDDVAASLLTPRFGAADSYMTVADFESYKAAKKRAVEVYQDRTRFAQMSLTNIARAGIFSSDRSVEQYAKEIWDL